MSFLAPFYLLGGLAIALPIAFHMIRRTPKGRQVFGSVMFLSPSPPRMTRRSRIEDWLLLILRGLVVCLLAFAFARPFLRAKEQRESSASSSKRIVILLDRSASMQRDGYWDRAIQSLEEAARSASPLDSVQVQMFDTTAENLITFAEWDAMPAAARVKSLMQRAQETTASWNGTEAGEVLLKAADSFAGDEKTTAPQKLLVLISDLQTGAGWDALHSATWPEDVHVRIVNVAETNETNASMQIVAATNTTAFKPRVRVSNNSNSTSESFQIAWKDEFETEMSATDRRTSVSVSVPPGVSLVVPAPELPQDHRSNALLLSGDTVEFDNLHYTLPHQVRQIQIVYLGNPDEVNSPQHLRFFLNPLFPDTADRKVEIIDWNQTPVPPDLAPEGPDWIIIGTRPDAAQMNWLKSWIEAGGRALFIARNPEQSLALYDLASLPPVKVPEAKVDRDAMLGRVDLNHPVLQQFDDPRFSDFTKLRFWKYRKFDATSLPNLHVLAFFEDGSPAFAEMPVGQGRIGLLASGWNRDDSDLAVWSKFVPLMNRWLEYASPHPVLQRHFTVGDEIALNTLGIDAKQIAVGIESEVTMHSVNETWRFERPGIFRFAASRDAFKLPSTLHVAVNLPAEESRTEPYPPELLAAAGLQLEGKKADAASLDADPLLQRQLRNQELEAQQHWWQWLVVVAIVFLIAESALAMRQDRIIKV